MTSTTAVVGQRLEDVDTPALLIELDAFERNLRTMADSVKGRGMRVRAHAKTHKCPEIAKRQIAMGAVGVLLVTPQTASRYLPTSAAAPLAILVVGVVLLGSAVWLARHRAGSRERRV